jgi:hypothetical protein
VNIVAFVSDRSAPPDDRQWTAGAWVKPVEMDVMLADFKDWDKIPTALLKVRFRSIFPIFSHTDVITLKAHR